MKGANLGRYQANLSRFYHPPSAPPASGNDDDYGSAGSGSSLAKAGYGSEQGTPDRYKGAKVFGRKTHIHPPNAIQELDANLQKGPDGPVQNYSPMYIPADRNDAELDAVRYGEAIPKSPMQQAANVADQVEHNQQAEETRLGGVYSPLGLESASKDASLDAADRQLLRSRLVGPRGIGGQYAVGPGVY
jgi:hypothetical protein